MNARALLEVSGLTMRFGGLTAVDAVSFAVGEGTITSLIGPNGAGKTTVFNCITGFYAPTAGSIVLRGPQGPLALQGLGSHRICARAGVARTFQNIRLFKGLSLLENLLVAQHKRLSRESLWSIGGLLGLPSWRRAERRALDEAARWLERIGLLAKADEPAGTLPYGDQRRLEIARAMCTRPRLLCLDEPAAGLNATESAQLAALLRAIRDEDRTTILLIEHDMSVVMTISDRVVVLEYGRRIAEGDPAHVRGHPEVVRAYLGIEDEDEAAVAAA